MKYISLWNSLNHFTLKKPSTSQKDVWSVEEFQRIFDRERARVRRSGHEFSLVVFYAGSAHRTRVLAHMLPHRVRLTDEVGWLDKTRIGVLLPNTPIEGAWKLADDICQEMSDSGAPPIHTVYTYPSGEWSDQRRSTQGSGPVEEFPIIQQGKQEERIESSLARPIPLWKRTMDIVGAAAGLILFTPLFLMIGALIKLVSPGPAFFRQERIGYLGKSFTLWKFRTMKPDVDTSNHKDYLGKLIRYADQPMTKLDTHHDARIIPIGRLLRTLYLDELPQLINVLRGEMSLVGPRPCLPYEARLYFLWHSGRFDVVPGMTGLWQVSGKNRTSFNEMMRLDITYAKRRSFWLDMMILLKTIPAIFGP